MQEIINNILKDFPMYFQAFLAIIGLLTSVATIIVKLTPSPKDDEVLDGFKLKWNKFLAFLPTFGYNKHQDAIVASEEKKP